jgi:MoaA/NifB/PqqE/SkfB family radical SAM enzyme
MCDIGQREKDFQFAKNLCISQDIELPLSVFRRVVDEVLFFRPSVSIVATEPLLYSDILSASRYVKERGLSLSITTNGLLLKKYIEPLLRIGLDDLWISLDGTRELNDSIRGVQGSFDNAIRGIRLTHSLKKEMKSKKPTIHINFTISDLNCHNLLDFAKEMIEEKVDSINFSHLNFVTEEMAKKHNDQFGLFCKTTLSSVKGVNPQKIDFENLHGQIKEILKRFPKGGVTFTPDLQDKRLLGDYYLRPDLRVGKKRCLVPWTTASVQPNGDMVVLSRCFNYIVGNLMKEHFLEIWGGQRYQSFRRKLSENEYFPACTRCCGIL